MTDYQALYEACKLQAQCHAQEARTANGTIAEIYQLISGATGEPGNWNGAEPVRAYIGDRDSKLEAYRKALEAACGYLTNAKIDLQTGCTKATAIKTIEGGLTMIKQTLAEDPRP